MQNIKPICQELFELSRHIKSDDRQTDGRTDCRTDRRTDERTDRKGDYYRAPAFSKQTVITDIEDSHWGLYQML